MRKLTHEHGVYVAHLMMYYGLGDYKFDAVKQTFTHYLTSAEIAVIAGEYTDMAGYLEAVGAAQEENVLSAMGGVSMLQDAISARVSGGMDDHMWINKHLFDRDERTWEAWSVHIIDIQESFNKVWPGCSEPLTDEEIKSVVDFFKEDIGNALYD